MKYVIEFRSGNFFRNLRDEIGVLKQDARRFPSKTKAKALMRKHWWILANGGMVIKA